MVRELVVRGVRDGLLGGNGIWLAFGAVAWLGRFLSRQPATRIVREQIRVGETITVTSVAPPPYGRRARQLAKADRKVAKATRREVRSERRNAEPASAPAGASEGSAGKHAEGGSRAGSGGA